MKIHSKILLTLALVVTATAATAAVRAFVIDPPAHKNLFTLKTEKDLIGAQVKVYNFDGELITSQSMQKRKMIIDFADVLDGTYTIKVTKGEASKEYKYVKK
jgi:hypothetical protein